MKRADFEALNRRHGVAHGRWFRQRSFGRRHLDGRLPGLCAGLIQLWWQARLSGGDVLARLAEPSPELLAELAEAQRASTYLEAISEDSVVAEEDRPLLLLKYGTDDPALIAAELRKSGAEDCLAFDLKRQLGCRIAGRRDFQELGPPVAEALLAGGGDRPRLNLLILRYRRQQAGGEIRSGHRLAMIAPPAEPRSMAGTRVEAGAGPWRELGSKEETRAGNWSGPERGTSRLFFDPNCGEVPISDGQGFAAWFEDFRSLSPYDGRLAASPAEDRLIRLYVLEPAVSDPARLVPAEGDPVEADLAERVPTKEVPRKPDPAEEELASGDPAENELKEGDPAELAPAYGDPSEGDPVEADLAEGVPTQRVPKRAEPAGRETPVGATAGEGSGTCV